MRESQAVNVKSMFFNDFRSIPLSHALWLFHSASFQRKCTTPIGSNTGFAHSISTCRIQLHNQQITWQPIMGESPTLIIFISHSTCSKALLNYVVNLTLRSIVIMDFKYYDWLISDVFKPFFQASLSCSFRILFSNLVLWTIGPLCG